MVGSSSASVEDYRQQLSALFLPFRVPRSGASLAVATQSASQQVACFHRTRVLARHDRPFGGSRTEADIARHAPDEYILIAPRSSHLSYTQFGRRADLLPGACVLIDARSPYAFERRRAGATECHHIPGAMLRDVLANPQDLCARPIDIRTGLGAAVRALLATAWRQMAVLGDSDRLHLMHGIVALLPAAAHRPDRSARPAVPATPYVRALAHIEAHAQDHDLAPAGIASAIGVSVSALHAAARRHGTSIGAQIIGLRLDRCRQMLADPAYRDQRITDIAFAMGFSDAAHFSRSFRRRFGCAPSQWRAKTLHARPDRQDVA